MNRKDIFVSIIAIICMILGFADIKAENQPIGTWNIYPAFAVPPQKVIDTGKMVYYTSGNNLFSYDKDSDESYSYTINNKLSDNNISNIYYNFENRFLVVAYKSGNIDLLYDNGDIYNMSDIKDSSVEGNLGVNGVAFDGDNMYVATGFGLVQFDCKRYEVKQSGIYNKPVNSVAIVGDNILIYADKYLRFIKKGDKISYLTNFVDLYTAAVPSEIKGISDNQFLLLSSSTNDRLNLHTVDFDNKKLVNKKQISGYHAVFPYLITGKDNRIYYCADDKLYIIGDDFRERLLVDFPEEFKGSIIGTFDGEESVWTLNREGLANHSFGDGVTVNVQRFRPEDFSVNGVYYLYPTRDNKYLYAQNLGATSYKFGLSGNESLGYSRIQNASKIELLTGDSKDVTLYPVDTRLNTRPGSTLGKYVTACSSLVPDPDEEDVYFLSSIQEGVMKVKDGELIGKYDSSNSPFTIMDNRYISYGVGIDRGGNLWVMRAKGSANLEPIIILPADKRKLDPKDVKPEDWYVPDLFHGGGYAGGQDAVFLNCKKSNMIFVVSSNGKQLLVCDTKGSFSNLTDDKFHIWEGFTDQDGKRLSPGWIISAVEDLNGHVWIGTSEGVIEISSPSNATNPNMTVTHVKVPRNDGTNMADYLLGTDMIYSIAVDAANRKWLATKDSGLFLVTPSGNEILQTFNIDNSPLSSNMVNTVYADPNSSMIYIGTSTGLYTYSSDATPAKSDYSEIYAYPNPVRPDYSGPVYVRGLMDNSLVKITDISRAVIYQGRSEGGLFTWDVCNSSGRRVPTGVYYVMASQNASGSSSGAVTKIMVVN